MILATRFAFIVKRSLKKTRIFTQKFPDHLRLMRSYIITIATDHH